MEQLFTMKRLEEFVPAHHPPLRRMFGCQDPGPLFEDVFGKALALALQIQMPRKTDPISQITFALALHLDQSSQLLVANSWIVIE
ncbi:hypothetical protein [Bradyrhizobium sp. CSS354]|uniref:hypothetical protein n=1 Tax=Bradyrhizobium sp. CSS354 TaxID=2699172 RepID=UPI0023B138A4|nr:hypothetical protein [Bradyrhizobium sp. CSS354]